MVILYFMARICVIIVSNIRQVSPTTDLSYSGCKKKYTSCDRIIDGIFFI